MPRKKKNKGQSQQASAVVQPVQVVAVPSTSASSQQKKKKKKKSKSSSTNSGESMVLHKSEMISAVTVDNGASSTGLMAAIDFDTLPYLKRFANLFERWTITSLKFSFKTACPTTQGGRIQMGFDWSSSLPLTTDRAKISQLTPTVGGVVWKDFSMQIPSGRLMTRPFYFVGGGMDQVDKSPGKLLLAVDLSGKASGGFCVGEVWCEYTIKMMDTRPA